MASQSSIALESLLSAISCSPAPPLSSPSLSSPLSSFLSCFSSTFDFSGDHSLPNDAKSSIIDYILSNLSSVESLLPDRRLQWLQTLKVITRTKVGLSSLFDIKCLEALLKPPSHWCTLPSPFRFSLPLETLRILQNLCVVDRTHIHGLLKDKANFGIVDSLVAFIKDDAKFEAEGKVDGSEEMVILSAALRVILLLILSKDIARHCVVDLDFYHHLIRRFLSVTSPLESVFPTSVDLSDWNRRRVASDVVKILCTVGMEAKDEWAEGSEGYPSLKVKCSKEDKEVMGQRIADVMAWGDGVPGDVMKHYKEIMGGDSGGTEGRKGEKSEGSSPSIARPQTRVALSYIAAQNADPNEGDTIRTTFRELRVDIAYCLLYMDTSLFDSVPSDTLLRCLHTLITMWHVGLIVAKSDRKQSESLLSPLTALLNSVCTHNVAARRFVKAAIFLEYADKRSSESSQSSSSPNATMMAAGAISEKVIDSDPQSLKALCIPLLTSMNYTLKQMVGELLFTLADEESKEFLRLVGFGHGVGLLAEKGLPGFAGLTQNAINLADLAKGKKL